MADPKVLILGYSEAAMFLAQSPRPRVDAVLSIHGRREYAIDAAGVPNVRVLQFDDTELPDKSESFAEARAAIRRREAAAIGLVLCPPNESHAKAILEFAEATRRVDGFVLFQCLAGVSRSPAAALICMAAWAGDGRESDCVKLLYDIRPCCQPHRGLVALGDSLLKCDGRLLTALDSFQLE